MGSKIVSREYKKHLIGLVLNRCFTENRVFLQQLWVVPIYMYHCIERKHQVVCMTMEHYHFRKPKITKLCSKLSLKVELKIVVMSKIHLGGQKQLRQLPLISVSDQAYGFEIFSFPFM